jgi:hypothetical protein
MPENTRRLPGVVDDFADQRFTWPVSEARAGGTFIAVETNNQLTLGGRWKSATTKIAGPPKHDPPSQQCGPVVPAPTGTVDGSVEHPVCEAFPPAPRAREAGLLSLVTRIHPQTASIHAG